MVRCMVKVLLMDVLVPLIDLPGHPRLRSAAAGQYDVSFTRSQYGRIALSVTAPTERNNLPANLRSIADITAFKKAIKTHFFRQAYSYNFRSTFKSICLSIIMLMFCM